MTSRYGADLVLLCHLGFILFATLGGLLVLWRRGIAALHLPALAWGLWIELSHGICPLTRLENTLRERAGEAGYPGSFVEHYLLPLIYPPGLRADQQLVLAAGLGLLNLLIYGSLAVRLRRRRRA